MTIINVIYVNKKSGKIEASLLDDPIDKESQVQRNKRVEI
jgi:hypothetical protein